MANNYLDKNSLIYLWGKIKAALAGKSNTDHTHNYAGSSSAGGAANSATKLKTARTIDGVDFNGTSAIAHFGTCSTAAATAAKVVACTGFKLVTGARIIVKFTITNTVANPTLNVNGSGAKAIQYRGSAISAGYLAANRTLEFVYDGSVYQLVGDLDTNTTYAAFKAATASAAGSAGLVPAPAAGKQASYLRGDGAWAVPPDNNTWRGIVNNLTSDSTTDSLSAAQGKELKRLVDNAGAKLVDGFTIPSTATWTQLTTANVTSLDPNYIKFDPSLAYPWFTDISYTCSENDTIRPKWPIGTDGIGWYVRVSANKLRIYADSNKNGTALTVPECEKG